jgi:hypothetical protein
MNIPFEKVAICIEFSFGWLPEIPPLAQPLYLESLRLFFLIDDCHRSWLKEIFEVLLLSADLLVVIHL